ncbi:MAG: glycerophosphodiester phosphodiesterase [Euzebya sp.]
MERARTALFSPPAPTVVGHRGFPLTVRENTPESFAAAAAAGASWVELDARMNASGEVIVHHDPALADGRPLIQLSTAETTQAGVFLLAQVLAGLPPGLGIDLEIKNFPGEADHDPDMAVVTACAQVLVDHRGSRPLVLSSFNPLVLMAAAELDHPLALLTIGTTMSTAIQAAVDLGCRGVFPHHTTDGLDAAGVQTAHSQDLEVLVWTVDQAAMAQRLAGIGVDALCTNRPDLLILTRSG